MQPFNIRAQGPSDAPAAALADALPPSLADVISLNWEILAKSQIIIGRDIGADIRLDDKTVSRRHSELRRDPFGRWTVRDLASRNGTSVNGVPVREREVLGGDEINVGRFTLRFPVTPLPDQPRALEAAQSVDDAGALEVITLQKHETLAAPRLLASHLGTLLDFGHQLSGREDAAERLRMLCRLVTRPEFRATGAAVLRVTPQTAHAPSIVGAPELLPQRPWYISRTLIGSVLRSRQPAMGTSAAAPGGGAALEMSIATHDHRGAIAAIACPLAEQAAGALDMLYVCLPCECGTAEWLALMALAARQFTQAESIWQARKQAQAHAVIEQELQQARSIQKRLSPTPFRAANIEVFVHMEPCRWVGGDYADIIPLSNGGVFIAVADVCGKGMQAALVASGLHTLVRTAVNVGLPVDRVMEIANRHLCEYMPDGAFVTMTALEIDMATGRMTCANAGHLPALVIRPDGTVISLPVGENLPLGLDPAAPRCKPYDLAAGDIVALFTDGWTEARYPDRTLLGHDQFGKCLGAALQASHFQLDQVLDAMIAMLKNIGISDLDADDRALVLAHYK